MTESHDPFSRIKWGYIRLMLLRYCDVLNRSFKCLLTNETEISDLFTGGWNTF